MKYALFAARFNLSTVTLLGTVPEADSESNLTLSSFEKANCGSIEGTKKSERRIRVSLSI